MSARRVITHRAVVLGGVRHFVQRSTLEMDALAIELAISRATLYRVAHSRDALLGDVLWAIGSWLLQSARAARAGTGVDGVIEVSRRFAGLVAARPMRRFLADEPAAAHRVLFTPAGRVHERAVAAQRDIFVEAGLGPPDAAGRPAGSEPDLDYLAFLYVRIMESTIYADMLSGHPPDFRTAEPALRGVLAHRTVTSARDPGSLHAVRTA